MNRLWTPAVAAALLISGCLADRNTVTDQFQEVNTDRWGWHEPKLFEFSISEKDRVYHFHLGLRITGSYPYSNIWLIYSLEGPGLNEKKLFQTELADNTGKWLGKGQNNLISYDKVFISNKRLVPGKYTLKISQNMRDEELKSVHDVGLKVVKGEKVY